MFTFFKCSQSLYLKIAEIMYIYSDSHVRSACIWLDTLCILVHLYEKYAILVIIFLFLIHAKWCEKLGQ